MRNECRATGHAYHNTTEDEILGGASTVHSHENIRDVWVFVWTKLVGNVCARAECDTEKCAHIK